MFSERFTAFADSLWDDTTSHKYPANIYNKNIDFDSVDLSAILVRFPHYIPNHSSGISWHFFKICFQSLQFVFGSPQGPKKSRLKREIKTKAWRNRILSVLLYMIYHSKENNCNKNPTPKCLSGKPEQFSTQDVENKYQCLRKHLTHATQINRPSSISLTSIYMAICMISLNEMFLSSRFCKT